MLTAALRSFSDMPFLGTLLLDEGCPIGEVKAKGVCCSAGVRTVEGTATEYVGSIAGIGPAS